jgi:hypothetical protein
MLLDEFAYRERRSAAEMMRGMERNVIFIKLH